MLRIVDVGAVDQVEILIGSAAADIQRRRKIGQGEDPWQRLQRPQQIRLCHLGNSVDLAGAQLNF